MQPGLPFLFPGHDGDSTVARMRKKERKTWLRMQNRRSSCCEPWSSSTSTSIEKRSSAARFNLNKEKSASCAFSTACSNPKCSQVFLSFFLDEGDSTLP